MNDDKRNFLLGFAAAIGSVAREYSPSIALDIMRCNGITLKQLQEAGAEKFDLAAIEEVEA